MGGFALAEYTVDPWPITVGANVKVTMRFRSTPGQPAFRTEVKIVEPDGNERTETLNSDALEAGGEATQEFSIQGAFQGYYRVEIDANPDGAATGPTAQRERLPAPDAGHGLRGHVGRSGGRAAGRYGHDAGIGYLAGLAGSRRGSGRRPRFRTPSTTWPASTASPPRSPRRLAPWATGCRVHREAGMTNLTELLTNIGVGAQQVAGNPEFDDARSAGAALRGPQGARRRPRGGHSGRLIEAEAGSTSAR